MKNITNYRFQISMMALSFLGLSESLFGLDWQNYACFWTVVAIGIVMVAAQGREIILNFINEK